MKHVITTVNIPFKPASAQYLLLFTIYYLKITTSFCSHTMQSSHVISLKTAKCFPFLGQSEII